MIYFYRFLRGSENLGYYELTYELNHATEGYTGRFFKVLLNIEDACHPLYFKEFVIVSVPSPSDYGGITQSRIDTSLINVL